MVDDTSKTPNDNDAGDTTRALPPAGQSHASEDKPREIGGRGGLDPARYGDWEKDGRCIDF